MNPVVFPMIGLAAIAIAIITIYIDIKKNMAKPH